VTTITFDTLHFANRLKHNQFRGNTMTTLQISDQAASILSNMAQQQHLSSSELIEQLIKKHNQELTKQPELLADFAGILADSPSFSGDPLEIQKAMRNEWD
jgi:predicted CopG family antitoxin